MSEGETTPRPLTPTETRRISWSVQPKRRTRVQQWLQSARNRPGMAALLSVGLSERERLSGSALAPIVAADLAHVRLVAVVALVELGRVLDLLLRAVDEDRFTVEILRLEALLGSACPTGGVGYGRSRGSRKGSSSSGCPPEIALPRASSAFISAPRRSATFEIQSQTRKMMIAPRLPYVLL